MNKRKRRALSQDIIDNFSYDPKTGKFYRKESGDEITLKDSEPKQEMVFYFNGTTIMAKIAAFLIMNGSRPKGKLDFFDGDYHNIIWSNIVEVAVVREAKDFHPELNFVREKMHILESLSFVIRRNPHKTRYIRHLQYLLQDKKNISKFSLMSVEDILDTIKDTIPLEVMNVRQTGS